MDTGQFSWILCTIQQWIHDCRYLLDILILSSLDINSKEWFLDLMIVLLTLFSFYNTQPERWYLLLTWFLFHWYLVMLSTMPMNIGHFSVFYEEISIEAFYTSFIFFKSVICLLLFWSWAVVVAIYSEYWPIMQIQSLQILLLIPSVYLSADCWGDHPFFTWSF